MNTVRPISKGFGALVEDNSRPGLGWEHPPTVGQPLRDAVLGSLPTNFFFWLRLTCAS